MRAHLIVLAVALAWLPTPPALADTLYKCVDATGLAAIQMKPCAKGQTQAWARDTAPEPPPTPEQAAAAQARAAEQERARAEAAERNAAAEEAQRLADAAKAAESPTPTQAPATTTGSPPDRCDEAKAFAAQVRAKPWLALDAAQMQRVYGWVAQECAAKPAPEQ